MNDINKNMILNTENKIKISSDTDLINTTNKLSGMSLNSRKDKYGTLITKRHKSHKITFSDQVDKNQSLAEVKVVDSYKKFNRWDENGDNNGIFIS